MSYGTGQESGSYNSGLLTKAQIAPWAFFDFRYPTTKTLLITKKLQPHPSFSVIAGSLLDERVLRGPQVKLPLLQPLAVSGHIEV
jgi:hypothetical protein